MIPPARGRLRRGVPTARRHDLALTCIGELEAVADEPFAHTDTLRDKRQRLDTFTAELRAAADSPDAHAARGSPFWAALIAGGVAGLVGVAYPWHRKRGRSP